jgi:2-polyprenyl-3-methyl-5-hydroxy-6-metoxy-1,4-benzoquinol methylase
MNYMVPNYLVYQDQNQCYLCNGTNFKKRPGSVRDNNKLKVLECKNCGLIFLSSFSHIISNHYKRSGMHGKKKPNINKWLDETYTDDIRRFNFIKEKIVNKSLLDFGCGIGGFLQLVQNSKLALSVTGVEQEEALKESFSDRQLNVFSDIMDVSGSTKYDIITAFHVIEHLSDPVSTLTELSKLLKKNGEIIIEVPSSEDALLTLYECDAFSHFTYWSQHLFLFNTKTLIKLVEKTALKVNWLKQIQRYPLSNHLYWLSKGLPGGHDVWGFLDEKSLNKAYEAQLDKIGKTDTIIASIVF